MTWEVVFVIVSRPKVSAALIGLPLNLMYCIVSVLVIPQIWSF